MQVNPDNNIQPSQLELLKFVVDNTTDFIGIWNLDFMPTYLNPQGMNTVGLESTEQLEQTPIPDFFFPEDVDFIMNQFFPVVFNVGRNECEVRFRHFKTGKAIWMIFNVILVKDNKGNPIGYATTSKNVSKQKTTEEELKESQHQLQFAIDAAQLGTWDYNPLTNHFSSNERLKQWFGLALEEHVELTHAINAMLESDRQRVTDAIQKALDFSSGGHYDIEYTIVQPVSKKEIIVHAKGRAWFNDEKVAYRFNGTLEDITERSLATQQIKDSVERYHNLIYSSPFAIGILRGEDLVITIGNDAIIEIWGKGKEIIGKPYFVALPELAEQGYKEVFTKVYKTGQPFNAVETPVNILQNGEMTLKYYNFLLYPQKNINGETDGIGIIATEVTSQALFNKKIKESEQRFAAAVQAVKGIIWTNNEKGEMEGEQQGWAELTGQEYHEYQGFGWSNAIHPDDVQPTIDAWKEAVREIKTFNFEHRVKMKDGSWRAFSIKAIPLKNDDGSLREWVGVHTDIQKQKTFATELERQVQERTKELAQNNIELDKMNKELQSFTYISSHDLQEPLRKIQTFASRIVATEYKNLSDAGQDYFKRMQDAAFRMQALIDDLLAYSRTATSERKYEKTDLGKIVEEVQADLKEELKQKNATIEATDLCLVNIIPFQFRQLLNNLLSNSLKFSNPAHPPHIKIKCEIAKGTALNNDQLSANTQYCHITVADNGIGFDQQFSNRIFDLFQRLHSREEYNGTGIGLAIVKKIVENHNGIITATGELNKGATFNIFLPVI